MSIPQVVVVFGFTTAAGGTCFDQQGLFTMGFIHCYSCRWVLNAPKSVFNINSCPLFHFVPNLPNKSSSAASLNRQEESFSFTVSTPGDLNSWTFDPLLTLIKETTQESEDKLLVGPDRSQEVASMFDIIVSKLDQSFERSCEKC